MAAKQFQLLPVNEKIDEKKVLKTVVDQLHNYRAVKVKIENYREQQEQGVILFPTLREGDENRPIEELDELLVKQMERALDQGISKMERTIIEMKYLSPAEATDVEIYVELGIKKAKFYELKKTAIANIAKSLGII